MPYIEFSNVTKKYKMGEVTIDALCGVNFSLEKGEFVIVAGESGAGKSTLLNILGGMDRATGGTIVVDGAHIENYTDKQLITYRRYDIGFVFQFYNLVQNLTALENVELATQICKNPFSPEMIMEKVGLKQRVAIARALAKNPKLLLCDEPTGALDYVTGKNILKLLQDTCRDFGMTIIVITHNLALAPMGDRLIRVKSGKVVSNEINKNPKPVEEIEW